MFVYILAALYPLLVFCLLVILKLPLRFAALGMGFLGLAYFASASAKKKRAAASGSPSSAPPCSWPWAFSALLPIPPCF
jgi:hypothetical protein